MELIVFLLIIGLVRLWLKVQQLKNQFEFRIGQLEYEIRMVQERDGDSQETQAYGDMIAPEKERPMDEAVEWPSGPEAVQETRPAPPEQRSFHRPEGLEQAPPEIRYEKELLPEETPGPESFSVPERVRPDWSHRFKKFKEDVDWEQFTGKKISAWLGGLSLFIAAAFFVKYSIDNNLIPMGFRLSFGAFLGLVSLIAANRFTGERYVMMRHTLTSCGIGVLYAMVYASSYYSYLPKPAGFFLLALVSTAAFVLSVYHRGVAISVLGVLGANATPVIVSTGSGNVIMLFCYLAVVNIGVYQVVRHLKSAMLLLVSAAATLTTLSLAVAAHFHYLPGETLSATWAANLVLFTFFLSLRNIDPDESPSIRWTGYLLFGSALVMSLFLLEKGGWPAMLVLTTALFCAISLGLKSAGWYVKVIPFSAISFLAALLWAFMRFDARTFSFSFILLLLYGIGGGVGPMVLVQRHGFNIRILRWFKVFPLAVVGISLVGLFREPSLSFWFWPTLLCLQIMGIGVSLFIRAFFQMGLLMILFLGAGLFFVFHAPEGFLGYGFFFFLFFAGFILYKTISFFRERFSGIAQDSKFYDTLSLNAVLSSGIGDLDKWMTAAPAVGAFVLLGAAFTVNHPFYPHPGMATLICFLFLNLFVSVRTRFQPMGSLSLLSAVISHSVWVFYPPLIPNIHVTAVAWSSVLFLAALAVPLIVFRAFDQWKQMINAWAIFEVSQGIFLLYSTAYAWEMEWVKWTPAILFCLKLPVVKMLLNTLQGKPERNSIIAFHGGVLLFYFSALPVLVLDHGWIGLALIFESSALLFLNQRISHDGLRWVSVVLMPVGLMILLINLPLLKGEGSPPLLNPAVISLVAAIFAQIFAVKKAIFPQPKLGRMALPHFFLWLAVGTGFYLLNLIVSDLFSGTGGRFHVMPGRDFSQWVCYGLLWAAFGGALWRVSRLPRVMRFAGLALFFLGAWGLISLPLLLPEAARHMRPLFNLGLLAYLPLMALLFHLFSKEPSGKTDYGLKNLFLAMFLISGFMMIKFASCTFFQAGRPFELIYDRTAAKAVASAAGWFFYGLGLLIWPRRLDRPFRLAGLFLSALGILKALYFPFRFRTEFGEMPPIINTPTLLFLVILGTIGYLTLKNWERSPWPLERVRPRVFWGVLLAMIAFMVLNIEIASLFAIRGNGFSMATRGSLSMQLAYSIGWLIFAIGLMAVGIRRRQIKVRWSAIILLVATSVKIFVMDLWKLGDLYRVGSLGGLAAVLIMVSFLYQRFLSGDNADET
jgi:uncharacterized membrane protein